MLRDARAGRLAIARYCTAQELAITAITVKRRRGQRVEPSSALAEVSRTG